MTIEQKDARLKELNQKCMKCREDSIRDGFKPPNPKSCLDICPIGREIHNLENPEWDAQDWNLPNWRSYTTTNPKSIAEIFCYAFCLYLLTYTNFCFIMS